MRHGALVQLRSTTRRRASDELSEASGGGRAAVKGGDFTEAEAERHAREREQEAKEREREAKDAALARVAELEAELARRGRG